MRLRQSSLRPLRINRARDTVQLELPHMQRACPPCDAGSLHKGDLDVPPRRRVRQVKAANEKGRGEEGGFDLAQRRIQVVGKGPGNGPRKPHVPTCHQTNQDPDDRASHPFGTTQARRGGDGRRGGLFHGKAGHVEDSFCRNRAVILGLP